MTLGDELGRTVRRNNEQACYPGWLVGTLASISLQLLHRAATRS